MQSSRSQPQGQHGKGQIQTRDKSKTSTTSGATAGGSGITKKSSTKPAVSATAVASASASASTKPGEKSFSEMTPAERVQSIKKQERKESANNAAWVERLKEQRQKKKAALKFKKEGDELADAFGKTSL